MILSDGNFEFNLRRMRCVKKYILIFLVLFITRSFCGCTAGDDIIGTKFGTAYFNKPQNTPKFVCSVAFEDKEIEIKDVSFCDKLIAIINGKPAGREFCKCAGDYQVTIDNKYLFHLHPTKIVVYTDLEEYTKFTVECSEEETQILYQIIEETD